jgi:DNA-binding transcriptional ArsR family regulator
MGGYEEWNDESDTLKEIQPPLSKAPPLGELEFVSDEKRARELDDPVRLAILSIMRAGIDDKKTDEQDDGVIIIRPVKRRSLSVVEIVKMSKKFEGKSAVGEITKNQVYHHLPKLIENKYVIKVGTVTKGGRTTDYYRRTAKGFVLVTALLDADEKMLEKKSREYNDRMLRVFDIDLTEKEKEELVKLRLAAYKKEVEGRAQVAKMIRSDVAEKDVLSMFEFLVTMQAMGTEEYIDIHKKMRDILFK